VTDAGVPSRLRLRSWVWSGLNALVRVIYAGVSAGAMLDAGRAETGGVLIVGASLLVAGRAFVLRVELTPDRLVVHSWLRNQRFARADIARLIPAEYDGLVVGEGGSSRRLQQLCLTTRDGREHHLRAVVTRTRSRRAARFCAAVTGHLSAQP